MRANGNGALGTASFLLGETRVLGKSVAGMDVVGETRLRGIGESEYGDGL